MDMESLSLPSVDSTAAVVSEAAVLGGTPSGADAPPVANLVGAAEGYGFATLSANEARVIGCLVEKQMTTPEYYPLTLNALVAACSQKNNRNPVLEYDEKTVVRTLDSLREKKLLWSVTLAGGRVPKYEHRLTEKCLLTKPAEQAVLAELLLRGPQTAGELRNRADRMSTFTSLEETQTILDGLCMRPVPLVARLPRLPGHKESRYTQLLCGAPDLATLGGGVAELPVEAARLAVQADDARLATLEAEVKGLRQELADLKAMFDQFKSQFT